MKVIKLSTRHTLSSPPPLSRSLSLSLATDRQAGDKNFSRQTPATCNSSSSSSISHGDSCVACWLRLSVAMATWEWEVVREGVGETRCTTLFGQSRHFYRHRMLLLLLLLSLLFLLNIHKWPKKMRGNCRRCQLLPPASRCGTVWQVQSKINALQSINFIEKWRIQFESFWIEYSLNLINSN